MTIEVDGEEIEVMLDANLEQAGERRLVVEVDSLSGDLIEDNDTIEIRVDVVIVPSESCTSRDILDGSTGT